ncbi:helix-turn-helix protein [compost metagenome]
MLSGATSIGAAVRRLRTEVTGLRQEQFARMCRISLRTLRQLELDEGNPTLQTLNAVFNRFGMQVGIVPLRR